MKSERSNGREMNLSMRKKTYKYTGEAQEVAGLGACTTSVDDFLYESRRENLEIERLDFKSVMTHEWVVCGGQ